MTSRSLRRRTKKLIKERLEWFPQKGMNQKKRTAKKGAGKKKAWARSVSPSSSSSEDSKPAVYLTKDQLPKELREALRISKMIFLLIVVSLY